MINKKIIEQLILFLILFQIIVDTFQGFLLLKLGSDFGVSQIYKLIIFFVCFLFACSFSNEKLKLIMLLIFSGVLILIYHLFNGSGEYIGLTISEYIKLISTVVIFTAVTNFSCVEPFEFLTKMSVLGIVVIVFNVVMSIFGFGTFAYGEHGLKGFFYAANAVSGIMAIMSGILFTLSFNKSKYLYFIASLLCISISAAIGTKSGIIGVAVLCLILPIFNRCKSYLTPILFFLVISIVLYSSIIFDWISDTGFWERVSYFYDSGGLSRAILSDRDLFFADIFPRFISSDYLDIIFGFGFERLNYLEKPLVEIDPLDILFIYGVLGILIYSYCISHIIILLRRLKFMHSESKDFMLLYNNSIFVSFVLIMIACVAGHIFFNGMVSSYWATILAVPFWYVKYEKK